MKKRSSSYRYGFIGIGRMAEVILRSMLRARIVRPQEVIVSRNSRSQLQRIARDLKVSTTTDNRQVAQSCPLIWIGVKPYHASAILEEIRPHLRKNATVLSMMAGISTAFIKRFLGSAASVIRLMPNTPALLGIGMTGVYFPASTSLATRSQVRRILEAMGKIIICTREADLDIITGLSGSGVAFVYHLIQGLIAGGEKAGLSSSDSRAVALQTLLGAAHMLQHSGQAPQSLVAQVVSKGGTTEAGLKILQQRKTAAALSEAVRAAARRAKTLREENERCRP